MEELLKQLLMQRAHSTLNEAAVEHQAVTQQLQARQQARMDPGIRSAQRLMRANRGMTPEAALRAGRDAVAGTGPGSMGASPGSIGARTDSSGVSMWADEPRPTPTIIPTEEMGQPITEAASPAAYLIDPEPGTPGERDALNSVLAARLAGGTTDYWGLQGLSPWSAPGVMSKLPEAMQSQEEDAIDMGPALGLPHEPANRIGGSGDDNRDKLAFPLAKPGQPSLRVRGGTSAILPEYGSAEAATGEPTAEELAAPRSPYLTPASMEDEDLERPARRAPRPAPQASPRVEQALKMFDAVRAGAPGAEHAFLAGLQYGLFDKPQVQMPQLSPTGQLAYDTSSSVQRAAPGLSDAFLKGLMEGTWPTR